MSTLDNKDATTSILAEIRKNHRDASPRVERSNLNMGTALQYKNKDMSQYLRSLLQDKENLEK